MRWPCPAPAYASRNSFFTSTYQEIPLDEVLTNVTHLVGNDVPVTKAERLQLGDELPGDPVAAPGAVEGDPGDPVAHRVGERPQLAHAGSARSMIASASTPAGSVP